VPSSRGLIYDVLKTTKPGGIVRLVTTESDIRLGIATLPVSEHRVPVAIPLIDAVREVSRSAHRWLDAAQTQ